MGIYLETPLQIEKAMQLRRDHGAQVVNKPEQLSDIPKDKTLTYFVPTPSIATLQRIAARASPTERTA